MKPTTRKRATEADERIHKDLISAQTANLLGGWSQMTGRISDSQVRYSKCMLGSRSKREKRVRMRRETCSQAEIDGNGELTPSPRKDREDVTAEAAERKRVGKKEGRRRSIGHSLHLYVLFDQLL